MSYYVLWIDHDHAKIFNFSPEGEKVSHLQNSHHQNHHTGHWEREQLEQQKKFYADIGDQLPATGKYLLLGPSMAKLEFKRYLEEHDKKNIAEGIVGIETLDKLTDGQVRDFAKKYFHKYNLFN